MTFDPLKVQMSSATASLKILDQNDGVITVPSASSGSPQSVTRTIAHNYGANTLLWQVGFTLQFTIGAPTPGLLTPYVSADGQTTVVSTIDNTNLYITGNAQTAGSPTLAYTVSYYYRILVP